MFFCSNTSQKAQLRAPLSHLQTAWTSFYPNLYSGGWQQPWWSGMHCIPSWLQGCRHCVSHNAPVEYKDFAVAISTREGSAEDDPPRYKLGSKPVQAVCKGESGALNWALLGGVRAENIWHQYPSHWQTPFFKTKP